MLCSVVYTSAYGSVAPILNNCIFASSFIALLLSEFFFLLRRHVIFEAES